MQLAFTFLLIEVCLYETHWIDAHITSQDVTQCGNLTCLHNAMCSNNGKSCQCRRGYQGDLCQNDLNECERGDPCYHRGICKNTYGSWRCDCLQGWKNNGFEQHCDVKTNQDINFRKCVTSWKGEWCQDQCFTSAECGQNQVCKKHGRGLLCLCVDGWQGTDCKTDVDECTKNPCNSFEVCLNTVGTYACKCPSGRQGGSCSEDIDECIAGPCNNSGTCINTDGSYSCSCAAGWLGTDCNEDVNECLTHPCNSSFSCHNIPGSFTCNAKTAPEKVDRGVLKTRIVLVAILGSLLLILIIIIILVAAKTKWRKTEKKERESTPVIQVKNGISDKKYDVPVMRHTDSPRKLHAGPAIYTQEKRGVSVVHPYGYATYQQNQLAVHRPYLDF